MSGNTNHLGAKDCVYIQLENIYTGKFERVENTPDGVVIVQGNNTPIVAKLKEKKEK